MVKTLRSLRIASRGSELALWQADSVSDHLRAMHPDLRVSIEIIRTTGDRILDVPLAKIGDRGLFTKEVDEALLDGRADLAVHSLKDLPTVIPEGLHLAAIGHREDPRDVLIGPRGHALTLNSLAPGARIGSSSLRRRSQLNHLRPDLEVVDLRGNLNTRLAKLDEGAYDAIILAAAGVLRLGWDDRISAFLSPEIWLPAVGQGALAIVARANDDEMAALLTSFHHSATAACVEAERNFLRALEGGCQVPIGALATIESDDLLSLDGFVGSLDGTVVLREQRQASLAEAAALGTDLAETLLARGAGVILQAIRAASDPPPVSPP